MAQWITRLTTDQKIPGSSPGVLAFVPTILQLAFCFLSLTSFSICASRDYLIQNFYLLFINFDPNLTQTQQVLTLKLSLLYHKLIICGNMKLVYLFIALFTTEIQIRFAVIFVHPQNIRSNRATRQFTDNAHLNYIPRYYTTKLQSYIKYQGVKAWNSIPQEIRSFSFRKFTLH